MTELIDTMLLVNHHSNGAFTGYVEGISVDDFFTLHNGRHRCHITKTQVKLGRLTLRHNGHWEWVGNWCWDNVKLTPEAIVRLLNWAKEVSHFDLESGAEPLWEWWHHSHEPMTADLLEQLLKENHETA